MVARGKQHNTGHTWRNHIQTKQKKTNWHWGGLGLTRHITVPTNLTQVLVWFSGLNNDAFALNLCLFQINLVAVVVVTLFVCLSK